MQNHHLGRCSAFLWSLEPRLDDGARFTFKDYQLSTAEFLKLFEEKISGAKTCMFLFPPVFGRKKIQLQFPAPRPTRAQKCLQASRAQAELYRSESHVTVSGYGEGWWSAERVVTDQMFYCPSHLARRLLARPQGTQGGLRRPPGLRLRGWNTPALAPIVTHNTDLPFVFMDLPEHASLGGLGE